MNREKYELMRTLLQPGRTVTVETNEGHAYSMNVRSRIGVGGAAPCFHLLDDDDEQIIVGMDGVQLVFVSDDELMRVPVRQMEVVTRFTF